MLLTESLDNFIYVFIYSSMRRLEHSVWYSDYATGWRYGAQIRVGARDCDILLEELRKTKRNFRIASVGTAAK
jgi:hypothetical protein